MLWLVAEAYYLIREHRLRGNRNAGRAWAENCWDRPVRRGDGAGVARNGIDMA